MNRKSRAQSSDPTLAKTRLCQSCYATLPIEFFGFSKYDAEGRGVCCAECRAQNGRLQRKLRYNAKSNIDDSLVRCVRTQNMLVLDSVFSTNKMELRGFDLTSKAEFKVYYGPGERLGGLKEFTMFTRNGEVLISWGLTGVPNMKEIILAYLKIHKIRLELSDLHVIQSKTQIYFL